MCGPLVPAVPSCILDPLREEFLALLPARPDRHPLGCHRRRIDDRIVFDKLIEALVFGCGYERLGDATCSATTLRRRRDEWIRLGIFDRLRLAALNAYERMIGLDLADVAGDGSASGPSASAAAAASRRPSTHPVNAASKAMPSTRASSRRKVLACGGRPPVMSWAATPPRSPIAAHESAPPRTAQRQIEHPLQRVTTAPPLAWIGHDLQRLQQRERRGGRRSSSHISAVVAPRRDADGEDEVAGTGLLAGDRQIRHLKTTTRPVPARIGTGQRAISRPCPSPCIGAWAR